MLVVGIDLGVFRLGGEKDNHTANVPGHKKIDKQRKLQLDTIYFFGWCQESYGAGVNYWSWVFFVWEARQLATPCMRPALRKN